MKTTARNQFADSITTVIRLCQSHTKILMLPWPVAEIPWCFSLGGADTVPVIGTLMYLVEDPENSYTSIPTSVYGAITTVMTVGCGARLPPCQQQNGAQQSVTGPEDC